MRSRIQAKNRKVHKLAKSPPRAKGIRQPNWGILEGIAKNRAPIMRTRTESRAPNLSPGAQRLARTKWAADHRSLAIAWSPLVSLARRQLRRPMRQTWPNSRGQRRRLTSQLGRDKERRRLRFRHLAAERFELGIELFDPLVGPGQLFVALLELSPQVQNGLLKGLQLIQQLPLLIL